MNVIYDVKTLAIGSLEKASIIRIGVTQQDDIEDDDCSDEVTID